MSKMDRSRGEEGGWNARYSMACEWVGRGLLDDVFEEVFPVVGQELLGGGEEEVDLVPV